MSPNLRRFATVVTLTGGITFCYATGSKGLAALFATLLVVYFGLAVLASGQDSAPPPPQL